ncbi:MAG: glycosyltransferase family 39 protein [Anaerolineaceae bacterium]|nr:glycosyltransferase family 39 protein [Anaerolineaceae bacterium]
MDEPSVLDYVKEKLAFWKASSIQIPAPEKETTAVSGEDSAPVSVLGSAVGIETGALDPLKPPEEKATGVRSDPAAQHYSPAGLLLSLAALALVLIAQSLLEPPSRGWTLSMFVYAIAAVLIGAAYFRDIVFPVNVPSDEQTAPIFTYRLTGILVGLVLMVLTFFFFGSSKEGDVPQFNIINTALWVLSIGYLIWAFWIPRGDGHGTSFWNKLKNFLAAPSWKIQLTRWGILLVLVAGMILFFRFYRLGDVPAEMVSDHAEKLLDVNDVLHGELRIFFPRNTGREAFQFYLTALMVKLFQTGVSFMALKLGTVICGLITLIYIYRLGNEIGNRWVALFALLFAGFSYWANIQSRIGLRFPLYPFFLAPTLFYLLRGLRQVKRNDFIFAGLWLGAGLHGYTADRIVPLVVVAGIIIYLLHRRGRDQRDYALWGLLIIALVSLAVFLPLFRFTLDHPDMVVFRSLTRMGDLERPLPGPAWQIFLQNTWNALVMFFWDDGDVWVHSVVHRPALDVISAGIFFIGLVLVGLRYIRKRNWVDLFLLVSIPLLLLPSILSLAFPNENPNLNRTAGAYVPVFLILAVGLEGLLSSIRRSLPSRLGVTAAWSLGLLLVVFSAINNFDLLFIKYDQSFRAAAWNTSEMGAVIRDFTHTLGKADNAWVVAYPYWVDTRLVGINAGYPTWDTAIDPQNFDITLNDPGAKLFLLNPQDMNGLSILQGLYPEGRYWIYPSRIPGKEFVVFQVPARDNMLLPDLSLAP